MKKHLLMWLCAAMLAFAGTTAFAQFNKGMSIADIQAQVQAQQKSGQNMQAIIAAAIKAGVNPGPLTTALLNVLGVSAGAQIVQNVVAAVPPGQGRQVIDSAILAGVPPNVVEDAAVAGGMSRQQAAAFVKAAVAGLESGRTAQRVANAATSGSGAGGGGGGGSTSGTASGT